jgi:hypothetical protein
MQGEKKEKLVSGIFGYVKQSHERAPKELHLGQAPVHVLEPLPKNVDLSTVLSRVEYLLPDKILNIIDVVYVKHLKEFETRDVNALYKDGAIYVTSMQDNNHDMIDDLIHEFAHALESAHGQQLYEDEKIQKEFLGKRIRLESILRAAGFDTAAYNFKNLEYSQDLDGFFFKDIGYPSLVNYTHGLFLGPYSVTSLREYFATGFEEYFMGDRRILNSLSPSVHEKLNDLILEDYINELEMEKRD